MPENQEPKWKIVIGGKTASDVHGVILRDQIHAIVEGSKDKPYPFGELKGFVRNIKNTQETHVVFQSDEQAATELKESIKSVIKKGDLLDEERISVSNPFKIEDQSIKLEPFHIVREDELTELVWAMQNAGKTLFRQEEIREKRRAERLMRGVESELKELQVWIDDITKKKHKRPFRLLATENFLREPPENTEELTKFLRSLIGPCEEVNHLLEKGATEEKIGDNTGVILEIINKIKERSFMNI